MIPIIRVHISMGVDADEGVVC